MVLTLTVGWFPRLQILHNQTISLHVSSIEAVIPTAEKPPSVRPYLQGECTAYTDTC